MAPINRAAPGSLSKPLPRARAQIADRGCFAAGSITRRCTRCGNSSCRRHREPPQMHGPYWQWTAKVDGKTVTRRLSQSEYSVL